MSEPSRPPKLLLLTTEPLPLPGLPTTGAGLRAWGLGFGLRSAGFPETRLAFAADSVRGREVNTDLVSGVRTFERGRIAELLEDEKPDAVILQHWGLAKDVPALDVPLAIDLAGPHLLERRLWGSADPEADRREKLAALARADFAVCSGAFQRHYFLPYLFEAGFAPDAGLCPVIPFSVSPDIPQPAGDRDTSAFLYSGFFLPWQDPQQTLEWTLESLDRRDKGRLVVAGGPHPSTDVSGGKFDALVEKLDTHNRVERHGTMAFEKLLGLMRGCGAAIDLMPRNPERELAFPTRTVVFLWAGLPVIHNNYDELAEPIRKARAGWVLDPADQKGFQRVIERLTSHGEDVVSRGEKAQKLVRENYTWDRTITPLAEWCRDPHERAGKRPAQESVPAPVEKQAAGKPPQRRPEPALPAPAPAAGGSSLGSAAALLLAMPVGAALLLIFGLGEIVRAILRPGR